MLIKPDNLNVMTVNHDPVALLLAKEAKDDVFQLESEGESVEGLNLKIGNTNCRYRFSTGVKEFMNQWSRQGPAHHCAIGVAHIANKIEKLGQLLNIDVVKIC